MTLRERKTLRAESMCWNLTFNGNSCLQSDCPQVKEAADMKANVTFLLNQFAELGLTPGEVPTASMAIEPALEEVPEETTEGWLLPSAPGD